MITMSSDCSPAATSELTSQRTTGVPSLPRIASKACVVGFAGIHCGIG